MPQPDTTTLPRLPHWEQAPADIPAAIRQVKAALRARIVASGRTVEEIVAVVEQHLAAEVDEIITARERGDTVWPVIDYADIEAGTVSAEARALLHRRGCLVVRGHFDRDQALTWDRNFMDYVESNQFFKHYRGPADDFFASVDSEPEIYPIYWSPPQMQARQHDRMARVQAFLNGLWKHESDGVQWFDPGRYLLYPDRVRRRPPGTDSAGLGPHLDPGSIDLWMIQGYQKAFRHLFDGTVEQYDPWDAAYRTAAPQYPASTMCSAFRTFQGWTAMSDMRHDQGVLHTVPIPGAMAYLMLRPLLDDVPDDDLCGVAIGQAFPATEKWHHLLLPALTGIPDVQAGDSVWWHCDMIHSVAPVADQQGWGNVMYIPAAPWCQRNEQYAPSVRETFLAGSSPSDFPDEHYEHAWANRFGVQDLNDTGRSGLGFEQPR
jgi:Protein of unknown function (DUF1479)